MTVFNSVKAYPQTVKDGLCGYTFTTSRCKVILNQLSNESGGYLNLNLLNLSMKWKNKVMHNCYYHSLSVKNSSGHKVKVIHTDMGRPYKVQFCTQVGVKRLL